MRSFNLLKKSKEFIEKPKNFEHKHKFLFQNIGLENRESKKYFQFEKILLDNHGNIRTTNKLVIENYLNLNNLNSFKIIKSILLIITFVCKFLKGFFYTKKKISNVIVIHNRHSHGYFHWVTDILPKIALIKTNRRFKNYKVFLPFFKTKFQRETLFILKKNQIISEERNTLFEINNCIYIPELFLSGNPRSDLLKLTNKIYKKKIKNNYKYKKIYISRKIASRRNLYKEEIFENKLRHLGFKILYMEKLSFKKQVEVCGNSNIIVGLTGAGMANIIWAKKGAKVINIRPDNDPYIPFSVFSSCLDLNYYYFLAKNISYFNSTTNANFAINQEKFMQKFKKILK